ncbi:SIMPL domain-containing protein [Pseudohongiella spirulinae]|uniref:Periplasmic/secreted protein n=1 Tax=Pseudohongiella spirulinae TaxID=1249552 RepID=A0A0S2KFF4_9GAMM|nr:SIMPL domain-containing protein [Pseudohongiella spirulinae]ALO47018.1 hypothetical protein PS2015_2384 [Pseudohongiella spirulinae]
MIKAFRAPVTGLISTLLLLAPFTLVQAQTASLLPQGQTLITLSVTERSQVAQDELLAELRVEVEDRDARAVQDAINSTMAEALQLASGSSTVDVATGHYGVYQFNRQPQASRPDPVWRGTQHIRLTSKDAAELLELAGDLQEQGFVMNQLSWRLSTEKADEVRDSLMEAAIARAQSKVQRAAAALGKSDFDMASVNVVGAMDFSPPVMMRAMAADSREMAQPVADAGETEVSLTISVQAVAR